MKKPTSKSLSKEEVGKKYGFRSGLEETIADALTKAGVSFSYEALAIPYTKPAKPSRYSPDFILPNGIVIETKGRFLTADRQKHLVLKQQYPDLELRFLFSNANARLTKQSPTTYAAWCQRHGFPYAHKTLPPGWLVELPIERSLNVLKELGYESL